MANADILGNQGFAARSQTFSLNIGPAVANAGGFWGTWDSQAIIFWCIELTQNFGFGNSYGDCTAAPEPDIAVITFLGPLVTESYGLALQSATNSAAFRLAIWEFIYDSGSMNLVSGALFVSNDYGHSVALALVQSWLTNIGSYTDNYHLSLLTSPSHQEFVAFGTPFQQRVPEPVGRAGRSGPGRHGARNSPHARRTRD